MTVPKKQYQCRLPWMCTCPALSREVNGGSDDMVLRGGGCPSRVAYREVATSVGQHKGCALLSGKKPTKQKEAVNLWQKKCMIKGSRRVLGVWIKHHLVQASTSRRLCLSHWTSSTAAFPGLDTVVMALFAFNYLATSYKLLWRELTFISFVKGGIPERETQSHGSCCKCSLYTLCMAFN